MDDGDSEVRRSVIAAVLLAVVCPGAGHLFAGRVRAAIVVALVVVAGFQLAAMLVAMLPIDILWSGAVLLAATLAAQLFFIVDAGRAARRGARPLPFNRAALCLVFIAVVFGAFEAFSMLRKTYVVDALQVSSASMAPTLQSGDHVLATKFGRDREARRADVVLFRYPADPAELMFKRVIGIAGDRLRFFPEYVEVNGRVLARQPCDVPVVRDRRCFVETDTDGHTYAIQEPAHVEEMGTAAPKTIIVPPEHVFVVGDSRKNSHDSTQWGPLPLDAVVGRARSIYLPFDRAGPLDHPR